MTSGDPAAHALFDRALALHLQGQPEAAEPLYRQVLAAEPDHADALTNLGIVLFQRGRLAEGVPFFQRSLEIRPDQANALANLANGLNAVGRHEEALEVCAAWIPRVPDSFEARLLYAHQFRELGRWDEALAAYQEALARGPDHVEAFYGAGNVLANLRRFEEALSLLDRAVALQPDHVAARNARGATLNELRRWDEALADLDHAIRLWPALAVAHGNRGNALRELGRLDEALAASRLSATLDPTYLDALNNIGVILGDMRRTEEALTAFDAALAADPTFPNTHWNRALLYVAAGRYAEAWPLFEWRKRLAIWDCMDQPLLEPGWLDRADLQGSTLLVQTEQGLGDTLQMLRYLPLLADRGVRVALTAPAALADLARSVRGVGEVVIEGEPLPPFDAACMMMSLPLGFGTTIDTVPAEMPYLSVDSGTRERWARRLGPRTRSRVALVWSGAVTYRNDHNRSIPLKTLLPLLDAHPDIEFHSLQVDYREADRALMQADGRIRDWGGEQAGLMDAAGLIEQMDLTVAVDTAVAHLAGALGKPLWLLLPWNADYRWGLQGETSPWYPTARLLRQPRLKDWESVIERLSRELGALFA